MEIDDRIAISFSRAVTRRRFLQRSMRTAIAVGAAGSTALLAPEVARAGTCSPGGAVGTWGCECASTQSCSGCRTCSECGYRGRCDQWSSPYCWCSLTCSSAFGYRFWSCCDCWTNGGSGCGCGSSCGGTACVAKHVHYV